VGKKRNGRVKGCFRAKRGVHPAKKKTRPRELERQGEPLVREKEKPLIGREGGQLVGTVTTGVPKVGKKKRERSLLPSRTQIDPFNA